MLFQGKIIHCDGSLSEKGTVGCGILMWKYNLYEQKFESTVTIRLSGGVSSTQAELHGICVALYQRKIKMYTYLFIVEQHKILLTVEVMCIQG